MDQGIMKLWEKLTKAMESFDSHVAWVGEKKGKKKKFTEPKGVIISCQTKIKPALIADHLKKHGFMFQDEIIQNGSFHAKIGSSAKLFVWTGNSRIQLELAPIPTE
jgi:hypothetical protein